MKVKKTLLLGASPNPSRYSYLALQKLQEQNHPVIAIGRHAGKIGSVYIETGLLPLEEIDTVTLYLNPVNQKAYYDYILSLHPGRIIFNPGAENEELMKLAGENGIECVTGCTLVMLATGLY